MWSDSVDVTSHVMDSEFNFDLSAKLKFRNKKSNVRVHKKSVNSTDVDDDGSASGWFGTIYKTSDAGATFTPVFNTGANDFYYFNSISCSDENHCVVVGEGQQGSRYISNFYI